MFWYGFLSGVLSVVGLICAIVFWFAVAVYLSERDFLYLERIFLGNSSKRRDSVRQLINKNILRQ